ncbi:MAG: DNA polymerase III subunit gamma/tau [Bacteroidetes bacterium]|nr:DNA polymerase III subunit gamma/tau [Bacteroidota bacterium]MBL0066633.1 DNA polymerase III subunit gamma/tau [Bacteroidota bacterium]MBL0138714.1 DNA polymerase III subunit gamma/tau [Bacteroidota bacterium]
MDKFIVSARKYRPVTFDTVVGQPSITNTLKNAIRNNHLAQAFLFTGPRGVGKTTTARILAKTINCENISANVEACNVCTSCISFNSGNSLNIYELDAASNNSVDDIRALVEQVRYAPQLGKYKVYIIDEVHMLSTSAFNAFLKTLEEPPSYAVFILATTEKHKIIPTILSRCQIFDFNRISVEDIATHLQSIAQKENVVAEEDALHIIAQKADGALRDALSLFDQLVSFAGSNLKYKDVIENLNILDYDYYFRITDDLLTGNMSAVLLAYNEILNNGFDGHNFINGLASHFRDLLVCKDEITLPLLEVSPSVREKYKVQSRNCSANWLLEKLEVANRADMGFKSSKNQRLHIELSLLKMCSATAPQPGAGEAFKKKTEPAISSTPTAAVSVTPSIPLPSPTIVSGALSKAEMETTTNVASAAPAIATTAPATKERTPMPGSSIRKTISISSKLYKEPEQATQQVAEILPDLQEPFSMTELEPVWNEYANQLQKQGRMTVSAALTKRKPELRENFALVFAVDSAAAEKDLNDQKADLLAFLRKKLSNYKLNLSIVIATGDTADSKPYTPSEKFKKLAEKNPLMHELKKRFDLEIEY